jgi:hypothetical protein
MAGYGSSAPSRTLWSASSTAVSRTEVCALPQRSACSTAVDSAIPALNAVLHQPLAPGLSDHISGRCELRMKGAVAASKGWAVPMA